MAGVGAAPASVVEGFAGFPGVCTAATVLGLVSVVGEAGASGFLAEVPGVSFAMVSVAGGGCVG